MYERRHRKGEKLRRTQISLAPEEHRLVQDLAVREGVSMSHVIREALRRYAIERVSDDPWERLLDLAGFVESGDPRASVDHDKVIYG